jgi:ligand-binding SRPBCC domain-containing protein
MKLYSLRREQVLPLSLEEAWGFFATPANLQQITPPWLHFSITSPVPGEMYAGLMVTYRLLLLGVPMTWVTEITHNRPPYYFVDEQRLGPYQLWHHEHIFQEDSHGVRMVDLVHYAMPLMALGRLIHRLMIRGRLEAIFDFRRERLQQLFPPPGETGRGLAGASTGGRR